MEIGRVPAPNGSGGHRARSATPLVFVSQRRGDAKRKGRRKGIETASLCQAEAKCHSLWRADRPTSILADAGQMLGIPHDSPVALVQAVGSTGGFAAFSGATAVERA